MGGVIIGHEMGRALGAEAIFVERPTGTLELRRGFALKEGGEGAAGGRCRHDRAFEPRGNGGNQGRGR